MLKINGEEMIVVNFVATSKHSSVDKAIVREFYSRTDSFGATLLPRGRWLISQYGLPCVGACRSSDPTPEAIQLLPESFQDQEHGAPTTECKLSSYWLSPSWRTQKTRRRNNRQPPHLRRNRTSEVLVWDTVSLPPSYAAPAVSYAHAPAAIGYSAPALSYHPAPVAKVAYTAPAVAKIAAPVAYSAPALSYSAPALSYSAPALGYAAPALGYASPAIAKVAAPVAYAAPAVAKFAAPAYGLSTAYGGYGYGGLGYLH
ncbi:postacrosomal sheath WW domain-binding protein-like [Zootermopsis nevadensis]|uniref:postacrosomal sheath WW domain-binding protein-like n=1 Tax=Zootermopsis nevadensis TaxID=136037 RepID=UPI000B8E3035|nr:postacrosomal sheath WW domain-binding protein-like [Zootermopsis nevadensis]